MEQTTFCPFCGGKNLTIGCPEWEARSLEPMDRDNTAVVQEYQCEDCEGRSFWI